MTKNQGIYVKSNGVHCTIPSHDHNPKECKGSGKIKCEVCGKSTSAHKTMAFCSDGKPATVHQINREGRRVKT